MIKYLIRLDDITECTQWDYFEKLENVFDNFNIKPIVGVVPFNKDKNIKSDYCISRKKFIEKVQCLYKKNYYIAMHGYNHLLKNTKTKSIVDINLYGEFVNVSDEDRCKFLKRGKKFFERYGINIDMYMPPAHWIDINTIKCLKNLGFRFITDGLFLFPEEKYGLLFVPQQLWRPRKIIIPGVYTICLHINNNSEKEIDQIIEFIKKNYKYIINIQDLEVQSYNRKFLKLGNKISNLLFKNYLKFKKRKYV